MVNRFPILFLILWLFAAIQVRAQSDNGLYTPAYSNPYSSPLSSATNTGAASLSGGAMAAPGNGNGGGNGGGNNGNGNGNGGNGVPLDTEAWALMLAGAAFGAWTVAKSRKSPTLKLHTPQ